jgi:hypothetical protein
MIAVRLHPSVPCEHLEPRRYALAGEELVSDRELPELASLDLRGVPAAARGRLARAAVNLPAATVASPAGAKPLFEDEAVVAGRRRPLRCAAAAAGYRLEIAGIGSFEVSHDGGFIGCAPATGAPAGISSVSAALLGPPLILALALRDTFCFHASAVARGGRTVAFVGSSGAGKSTLAVLLAALPGGDWRQIADDLLPWRAEADGARVLPRFPQAELDGHLATLPEQLPLAALYLLSPQPTGGAEAEVASRLLAPRRATVALVRHTVAARLFAPDLLARHLDACAALTATVPVRSLTVPWRVSAVLAVAATLAADLERSPGG